MTIDITTVDVAGTVQWLRTLEGSTTLTPADNHVLGLAATMLEAHAQRLSGQLVDIGFMADHILDLENITRLIAERPDTEPWEALGEWPRLQGVYRSVTTGC
jgi:hypothetical protein